MKGTCLYILRYGNFLPFGTNNESSDTSIAQPNNVKEKLNAIPDPGATWNTLRWLVNSTHLPVIAKGILTGMPSIFIPVNNYKSLKFLVFDYIFQIT